MTLLGRQRGYIDDNSTSDDYRSGHCAVTEGYIQWLVSELQRLKTSSRAARALHTRDPASTPEGPHAAPRRMNYTKLYDCSRWLFLEGLVPKVVNVNIQLGRICRAGGSDVKADLCDCMYNNK